MGSALSQGSRSDPDEFPPEFVDTALPLSEVASASFPRVVVSGGHSAGFDAICDDLADHIGASRPVIEGAGHEIQFTGEPINDLLLGLWRTTG